jgi:hypothetical protein
VSFLKGIFGSKSREPATMDAKLALVFADEVYQRLARERCPLCAKVVSDQLLRGSAGYDLCGTYTWEAERDFRLGVLRCYGLLALTQRSIGWGVILTRSVERANNYWQDRLGDTLELAVELLLACGMEMWPRQAGIEIAVQLRPDKPRLIALTAEEWMASRWRMGNRIVYPVIEDDDYARLATVVTSADWKAYEPSWR